MYTYNILYFKSLLPFIISFSCSQASESPSPSAREGQSPAASDPITGLQPSVPKDFHIFINLVDLCKQVHSAVIVSLQSDVIVSLQSDVIVSLQSDVIECVIAE